MKSSLKNMVLVLFTITAVSALLVGLVDYITKDTIAQTMQSKKNEAKFKVLNTSARDAEVAQEQVTEIGDFKVVVSTVVAKDDNTKVLGYAVEAPSITKSGYAGRIELMVGFVEKDNTTTISGVQVLAQGETPGLGAEIASAKVQDQFAGKAIYDATGAFAVRMQKGGAKNEHQVDAITGGTKTCDGVNAMLETSIQKYEAFLCGAEAEVEADTAAAEECTCGECCEEEIVEPINEEE